MAIAVNLYPTNYRAMATAFIMMCGRIGGVSGSSIVGLLLDNNCPLIFYLFGGILMSKCHSTRYFVPLNYDLVLSRFSFQVAQSSL